MSDHGASHVSGIQAGRDVRIKQSTVAVGQSTATTAPVPPEYATAVAELRRAASLLVGELRRNEEQYEDGPELVEAAERVEAELDRDEPRWNSIQRWLGFIAPGVHATAAVATDVEAIQRGVTTLLASLF
ncbi:hypothetical protein ADK53_12100 [Streptomyces sp. WM6373]|nr:hypothetical protein ADK53_12100 [Streptomyces sp. WM6373]KOU65041.1 hypothetical protein ADK96_19260 [Streptomyces sp. IGB124]KOU74518.1 hypothetical protein ADK61_19875 [Streptomyces sp. XY66]KOV33810.1 hypothetical protein ADK97_17675 [Streptomyces sp. H021]